jgi:hypothetical protein
MIFQEFVIYGCYWPARRPRGRKTRFLEKNVRMTTLYFLIFFHSALISGPIKLTRNQVQMAVTISFTDFRSAGSANPWKWLKPPTIFLWMILYLQICNSTRLKISIICSWNYLKFCGIIQLYNAVEHRSRYSYTVCTQNHVFYTRGLYEHLGTRLWQ